MLDHDNILLYLACYYDENNKDLKKIEKCKSCMVFGRMADLRKFLMSTWDVIAI